MANGVDAAIDAAQNLNELGFTEFTTKLITDTFDALVSANLRQMEAYSELLEATAGTLTEYVNDTKNDISADQLLGFLQALEVRSSDNANATIQPAAELVSVGESLNQTQAAAINDAVAVEGEDAPASQGALDQDGVDAIMEAVAKRISADTYTLLQRMVAQGMLRLIVDDGEILTRLHFRTTGSDYASSRSTDSQRRAFNARASASTGKLLSKWVKASGSTSYSSLRVKTLTERETSSTATTVDIFGQVRVNFRTDFAPLADLV